MGKVLPMLGFSYYVYGALVHCWPYINLNLGPNADPLRLGRHLPVQQCDEMIPNRCDSIIERDCACARHHCNKCEGVVHLRHRRGQLQSRNMYR